VAAGTRRRATTADVNITYTASVAAVASTTPAAKNGSKASIDTDYLDSLFPRCGKLALALEFL